MSSEEAPDPDELPALVDALRRKCARQAEEIETLRTRVGDLENLVDPDPGGTEYDQLTKDQKVQRLRSKLAEMAAARAGKHAMGYRDVMMLFNDRPSAGHCYNLMERAGQIDGYDYGENPEGEKRLTVKLDAVNDERVIHSVKKGYEPEAV